MLTWNSHKIRFSNFTRERQTKSNPISSLLIADRALTQLCTPRNLLPKSNDEVNTLELNPKMQLSYCIDRIATNFFTQ